MLTSTDSNEQGDEDDEFVEGGADDEFVEGGADDEFVEADGSIDDLLDDKRSGKRRADKAGAAVSRKRKLAPTDAPAELVDSGEELNSDDDDDAEEAVVAGEPNNLVLAQFDKVKRTRNKWHCTFKAGMASLNGIEYAFTNCEAEFTDGW